METKSELKLIGKSIEEKLKVSDISFLSEVLQLSNTFLLSSQEIEQSPVSFLLLLTEMRNQLKIQSAEINKLKSGNKELGDQLQVLLRENAELRKCRNRNQEDEIEHRSHSAEPENREPIMGLTQKSQSDIGIPGKRITKKMSAIRSNQIANFLKFNA